jgi:hypothetical protein
MTVTYESFLIGFPEFSNTTTYPQATVQFWIDQGAAQLSPKVFGSQIDMAVMLFAAHSSVLAAQRAKASAGGGIAGASGGIVASKAVADVSVSYDTTLTAIDGAGPYNATSYGQQLYMMMKANTGVYYFPGQQRNFGGYRGF